MEGMKAKIKQGISQITKFVMFRILFRSIYCKNAKKPLQENKVLFVEVREPSVSDSFRLLYRAFKKKGGYCVHVHYLRSGFIGKLDYTRRCCMMLKDMADAKYVFLNEGCNVIGSIPMRKETILTQTWHACGAFKKFGFSTAQLKYGKDAKEMQTYPYYGNTTYVTLSSPQVSWAYAQAMQLEDHPECLKAVGVSRTDVFFCDRYLQAAKKRVQQCLPIAAGKKIILYAPTFRGQAADASAPDQLDIPKMMEALGKDYVLAIKQHPFIKHPPEIPAGCENFAKDVTAELSIEDLICASDICISDYSSIIFEYALFERPMIFFSYDLDEYFDWRGFYYDYHQLTPGPVFDTNDAMIDYIMHIEERFDRQQVREFREQFMASCDGHATERILDMILNANEGT